MKDINVSTSLAPTAQSMPSSSASKRTRVLPHLGRVHLTKEDLDIILTKWIVGDGLPLSTTESQRFRTFAKALKANYKPMSRKSLGEKVKQLTKQVETEV